MARLMLSTLVVAVMLAGCERAPDVPSGTYTGTVKKVVADEREIYVDLADGRELELYFTDQTRLTRADQAVPFSHLAAGQKVTVEVRSADGRLDPVSVQVLD